jgi:hypothetical protein
LNLDRSPRKGGRACRNLEVVIHLLDFFNGRPNRATVAEAEAADTIVIG